MFFSVSIVFALLYVVVLLFFIALLIRLVYDWVQVFARSWKPRGAALVVAHGVYSVTDPPLRVLRRWLPPLRLGGISLDLGFLALFVAVGIVMAVLRNLA